MLWEQPEQITAEQIQVQVTSYSGLVSVCAQVGRAALCFPRLGSVFRALGIVTLLTVQGQNLERKVVN